MKIEEAAEEAIASLLPQKSCEIYKKRFLDYRKWCSEQHAENFTDEKVLLAYFLQRSKKFKASSLWSQYSMIKATMISESNVDISKYSKLRAFLKRQNDHYKPKKSKTLNFDNITDFLQNAPDEKYLAQKVRLFSLL